MKETLWPWRVMMVVPGPLQMWITRPCAQCASTNIRAIPVKVLGWPSASYSDAPASSAHVADCGRGLQVHLEFWYPAKPNVWMFIYEEYHRMVQGCDSKTQDKEYNTLYHSGWRSLWRSFLRLLIRGSILTLKRWGWAVASSVNTIIILPMGDEESSMTLRTRHILWLFRYSATLGTRPFANFWNPQNLIDKSNHIYR